MVPKKNTEVQPEWKTPSILKSAVKFKTPTPRRSQAARAAPIAPIAPIAQPDLANGPLPFSSPVLRECSPDADAQPPPSMSDFAMDEQLDQLVLGKF